jgi:hypothetical protein
MPGEPVVRLRSDRGLACCAASDCVLSVLHDVPQLPDPLAIDTSTSAAVLLVGLVNVGALTSVTLTPLLLRTVKAGPVTTIPVAAPASYPAANTPLELPEMLVETLVKLSCATGTMVIVAESVAVQLRVCPELNAGTLQLLCATTTRAGNSSAAITTAIPTPI